LGAEARELVRCETLAQYRLHPIAGPHLVRLAPEPSDHEGLVLVAGEQDLGAVVDFYNQRFNLGLTDDEADDLVAFLLTL